MHYIKKVENSQKSVLTSFQVHVGYTQYPKSGQNTQQSFKKSWHAILGPGPCLGQAWSTNKLIFFGIDLCHGRITSRLKRGLQVMDGYWTGPLACLVLSSVG